MDYSIEMNDAMRNMLEFMGGAWKSHAARALNRTALEGEAIIAKATPVQTSVLKNSITTKKATKDDLEAVIYTNIDYAPYVEYGIGQLTDWPEGTNSPDLRGFAPRAMFRTSMPYINRRLILNLRAEMERFNANNGEE